MQNPTEDDEASIPTETVSEDPNLNRTFTVRRKASKRSESSPLSIPARKKPRRGEPLATPTDEAARKTFSTDISVGLPLPPAADNNDANADSVTDAHDVLDCSIALTAGSMGTWTEDEDLKLKAAVQTQGGKNWNKIAAMVPGRTKKQCNKRWHNVLDPSIALTAGSTGTWAEDEDLKLKAAVQTHGGKNWNKVAALVPGRTVTQCQSRWYNVLNPSIALAAGRAGTWTENEDLKLKAAVQTHGGKNWNKIAAMVPGRTKRQCNKRWYNALDPRIALAAGSTGTWTEDEDIMLKAAVQIHGGKNWNKISALVPGRTATQCRDRWRHVLNLSIALTAGSMGTWTEDEDLKLKAAVQTHGGKNWNKISAMVGIKSPRWFQVERIGSVGIDGIMSWIAAAP
jgi:hypothetical protein